MNTQLANYLSDASGYKGHAEKLFIPADESELSAILADATKELTPVTISGAGTGLAGGRVAQGGWVISMEKFRVAPHAPPRIVFMYNALLLKNLWKSLRPQWAHS